MPTQLPGGPSLIPSSFATRAIGRDVSITILTASSLNSGEKLFFGRGNYFTFPDIHPNGWTVRKPRGTPVAGLARFVGRERELSRLRAALGAGTRLLLVVGDAGVGKTRFAGVGVRRAAAGGLVPVWGRCLP